MATLLYWVVRIVLVVALLGVAAAISTPRGRLPLALRGLKRMMRQDRGEKATTATDSGVSVPTWKRLIAFILVLAAVVIALI